MANHILAIHLNAGYASLAVAESSLRSLKIVTLAASSPSETFIQEYIGNQRWDRVVASLPGPDAFFRILEFPFKDRRKIAQAAAPALEEHVPLALEEAETAFDFVRGGRTNEVLIAMADRARVVQHKQALAELGVVPDTLVWAPSAVLELYRRSAAPETTFTAIDLGTDAATVAAFVDGKLTGLRTVAHAAEEIFVRNVRWSLETLDAPLDFILLGGSRAEECAEALGRAIAPLTLARLPENCPVDTSLSAAPAWRSCTTAIGLALAAAGEVTPPLLAFSGETAAAVGASSQYRDAARQVAPWAATAAGLLLTAGVLDYARLETASGKLEREAERVYQTVMPAGAGGSGLLTKLEMRRDELLRRRGELSGAGSEATPLAVLIEMSGSVPDNLDIEFETYDYDPPNVRLRGTGESFEAVTRLQQTLEESPRFREVEVSDVRTSVRGDGVDFELVIRLGGNRQSA